MTFPLVTVAGEHRDLGVAYGRQESGRIREAVSGYGALLTAFGVDGVARSGRLGAYREVVGDHLPWLLDELEGVAEGSGVPLVDVLLVNARSELISSGGAPFECTSVAVPSCLSKDGRPRLAQNWDWLTVMSGLPVVLSSAPAGQPAYVTFCEAGQVAKLGVNDRGLAVGINFLTTPEEDRAAVGIPVHLLLRAILAEEDVDGALAALLTLPIGGAVHLLLADRSGAVASVETRPSGTTIHEIPLGSVAAGVLTHANDFELSLPEGAPRPCRSARLASLLKGRLADRATLFEVLRDHSPDDPERICSHPSVGLASSSIASFVMEPAGSGDDPAPALWIVPGLPCEGAEPVRHVAVRK